MQIIVSLVIGLFSFSALAQEDISSGSTSTSIQDVNTESPEEQTETKRLKKIEITGSYIKRVDEEGPAPVQTITAEAIQKSGHNSVADIFRENTYTQQSQRENSLSTTPGVATAGIGPFGPDSVLVLLDGQRLPKVGGDNIVDLNMIPASAIERVEILKDGASATYGSDAIGGVMNFITKKDFDGANVTLNQNLPSQGGGARTDVGISLGKTFKKGNILGVVQYKANDELTDQDRGYSVINNVATEGSGTGNFGSWQDITVGTNNPSTFCPPENIAPNGNCAFDYSQYGWGIPAINQANTMLTANYRFTENLRSRSTVTFVRREVQTQLAPAPDTMVIPQASAAAVVGQQVGGDVLLKYRLADEAGPRRNNDITNSFNVSQSVEGKIAGSWNWDLSGSLGRYVSESRGTGYADKRAITQKIIDGTFNPLAAPGLKGDISDTFFESYKETASSQSEIKLVTTGQLYEGGQNFGPVAMAIGTSAAWQDYRENVDDITASKQAYGTVGSFGAGRRHFQSAFAELSVFPVETFEIGLAARADQYSDFGSTVNPKLSLSWQPNDKLLLRSSVGSGFRAPNLGDLYNGGMYGFPVIQDSVFCQQVQNTPGATTAEINAACLAQQRLISFSSNPNLKQEQSVFINTGFLAQPKKDWNIEGNFWMARIKDRVGALSATYAIQFEQQYGANSPELQQLGILIPRTPDGQLDPTGILMPSAFNLPEQDLRGIDFRISRDAKINVGVPLNVQISMDHLHILMDDSEDFPGLGMTSQRFLDWKNSVTISVSRNYHNVRLITRSLAGRDNYLNEFATGYGTTASFTTQDVVYSYGNLFGGVMTLGVRNLMASNQPLDMTQFAPSDRLNASLYDPLGRTYFLGYNYTF